MADGARVFQDGPPSLGSTVSSETINRFNFRIDQTFVALHKYCSKINKDVDRRRSFRGWPDAMFGGRHEKPERKR
jgi:hypothetical protein